MLAEERPRNCACGGRRAGDPDVRVIQRLTPPRVIDRISTPETRLALVVDCETTGFLTHDEIIELAVRPITYRASDGALLGVHAAYVGLQQPTRPLSEDIVALTGLRDLDLAGRSIDIATVAGLCAEASLVLAHSARFDRPFLERLVPELRDKPWACTIEDADWASEGLESSKLAYVAAIGFSFFFDAHRALDDVDAVVEILGREAKGGGTIFKKVLTSARAGRHRVRVIAAYETRHALKARGYRWDAGDRDLRAKCWFKDLADLDAVESERAALELICDRDAVVTAQHLSAIDRFSERA